MSETGTPPLVVTDSDGNSITLDDAYYAEVERARRERLACPPLSDEELAEMQARFPHQAWFWTREWYDGEREVDKSLERGERGRPGGPGP